MKNVFVNCSLCICLCFAVFGFLTIGKTWLDNIGRNPEASKSLFVPAMIAFSFIEVLSLICCGFIFMQI